MSEETNRSRHLLGTAVMTLAAASELLHDVFGKYKNPCRLVYGGASPPLGTPVELEINFEVAG